ncbi:MAG: hypothetical protein ABII00_19205 [Elusimicrobiota bacterium]
MAVFAAAAARAAGPGTLTVQGRHAAPNATISGTAHIGTSYSMGFSAQTDVNGVFQFTLTGLDASHFANPSSSLKLDVQTPSTAIIDIPFQSVPYAHRAALADALAADGADCPAGQAPLGVDASGAAYACFDVAIQAELDAEAATRQAADNAEAAARASADAAEASARQAGDAALQGTLTQEITDRIAGDAAAASQAALDQEIADRIAGDAAGASQAALNQEIADRAAGDAAEASARQAGDAALQGTLTQEIADRQAGDLTEAGIRLEGDSGLQAGIDKERLDGIAADDAEAAARAAADGTLQGNIDAEEAARIAADGVLQGDIAAETAARAASDAGLQTALDGHAADAGPHPWQADGSDIYFNSGNVGIGTTNPAVSLDIRVDAGGSDLLLANLRNWSTAPNSAAVLWLGGWYPSRIVGNTPDAGPSRRSTLLMQTHGAGSQDWNTGIFIDGYGKVGVGTTAPTQKLDVAGTVQASAFLGNGSGLTGVASDAELAAEQAARAAGDTDWAQGGGNVYRASGRVGVGTASPNTSLEIKDTTSQPVLRIDGGSTGKPKIQLFGQGKQLSIRHDEVGNSYGFIFTNESNAVDILAMHPMGNVGIGTLSPSQKLDVAGTVKATAFVGDGSQLSGIESGDPSYGSSASSPNDAAFVDDGGNVGIGTTSPQKRLHVKGGSEYAGTILADSSGPDQYSSIGLAKDGVVKWSLYNHPHGETLFFYSSIGLDVARMSPHGDFRADGTLSINGTDASYITGNTGIGTTSPTEKLEVAGTAKATSFIGDGSGLAGVATDAELNSHAANASAHHAKTADASELTGGLLANARLDPTVTLMGNAFNAANQLVKLDGSGKLPALDGSALTGITGGDTDWTESGGNVYRVGGNVGIGTASPAAKLDIDGDIKTSGALRMLSGQKLYMNGAPASAYLWDEGGWLTLHQRSGTGVKFGDSSNMILLTASGQTYNIDVNNMEGATLNLMHANQSLIVGGVGHDPNSGTVLRNRLGRFVTGFGNDSQQTLTSGLDLADVLIKRNVTGAHTEDGALLQLQKDVTGTSTHKSKYLKWGTTTADMGVIDKDGNVGIGTTAPAYPLDVNGNIRVGGTGASGEIYATGATGLVMVASHPGGDFYVYTGGTDGGAESLRIKEDGTVMMAHQRGSVGIGTAAPGAKLEVAGQVKITGGAPGAGKVLTSDAEGLAAWETPAAGAAESAIAAYRLLGISIAKNDVDGGFVVPFTGTIESVTILRKVKGDSGSTVVDIHLNGTTVFATQANRPSIGSADPDDSRVTVTGMDTTAVSAGDLLTCDVDEAEGGNPEDIITIVKMIKS